MTFASARERNHSRLRHSSRNLPLKLSVTPFCQGLPSSINAVLIPCATIKDKIAFDTNSGPLSLRRKAGAPRSLTRRARTSIDAFPDRLRGFRQGLKDTGYVECENVMILYRFAEN